MRRILRRWPRPGNAAAVGLQQRHLRRTALRLAVVVAIGLGLAGIGALPLPLRQGLASGDLAVLLRLGGMLLLLLIPIAGIYSLISQYAFWEGWLDGLPAPDQLFAPAADAGGEAVEGAAPPTRRYLIYLDGIHQSASDHPPRITEFLDLLQSRLPQDTELLRGLETYTVMPVSLQEDKGSRWFWQRLFALQESHPSPVVQGLCAALVQANNVIKVGISSDPRYGPILNYELALKIALRLSEAGYRPEAGAELVLLGYSGGGEMAMGVADYLRRLTRAPVRIITVCGVFSANQILDEVGAILTVVGSADPVAALGRLLYPGRLPWFRRSSWNRARQQGVVRRHVVGGMAHNGSRGPFSTICRQVVVDQVMAALA
ncbi:alpha/beta hydrolase [Cyanobium sp. FGCU-6]|jgi:hypothetical protein|nr:alpha/beta hydrolase [Cyanobium sp. FGCU6]